MIISYKEGQPEEILSQIREKLGGRKLGQMLQFHLEGGDLDVTIKKMGTSRLSFEQMSDGPSLRWELKSEKIALSHRAFKGEVLEKLTKVIQQTGGTVEG